MGRVVVDNSACCDNFHLKTDITDNHRYNTIPDEYQPFDEWVADFASRPKWNFSPFGDADETGREPLIVSEFGNWGLPILEKVLEAEGGEPYWFKTGDGPVRPESLCRAHNCAVTRSRSYSGSRWMPVPTCRVEVAARAEAAATSGAGVQPSYQKWCSAIHTE